MDPEKLILSFVVAPLSKAGQPRQKASRQHTKTEETERQRNQRGGGKKERERTRRDRENRNKKDREKTYTAKRKTDTDKWVIFSPDVGGIKKIEKYAESFGMDFGMIHKKRLNADKVEQKMIIGNVRGKNILMIDDMSESLGTLSGAAKLLKSKGAKKIVSFVTHLPLTEKGKQNLEKESYIDTIVTTNSIEGVSDHPRVHKIDIAPMLSDAISRTMNNKSISSLFDIKGF